MTNKSILFLISSIFTGNKEATKQLGFLGKQDWNKLVQVASSQLVFPALFSGISEYKYIYRIPSELLGYWEHIYKINYSRNSKIIDQANEIDRLLRKHNIKPVFLKGTAYLLSNLYQSIGDRMVGDIDILIKKNQILRAAKILKSAGYQTQNHTSPDINRFTKHYPRLVHEEWIAAAEIHRLPVNYEYSYALSTEDVIENAQPANKNQDILIPSYNHMLIHSFIHNQLANKTQIYREIDLRGIFDFYLLRNKITDNNLFIYPGIQRRFNIYNQLVSEIIQDECSYSTPYRLYRKQVFIALDTKTYRSLQLTIIFTFQLFRYYIQVLKRCAISGSYRTGIVKKVFQQKVWKNHIMNMYKAYLKKCRS